MNKHMSLHPVMRFTDFCLEVLAEVAMQRRRELLEARRSAVLAVKRFTNGELGQDGTFRRTCKDCNKIQSPHREVNQPCQFCGCSVVLWQ